MNGQAGTAQQGEDDARHQVPDPEPMTTCPTQRSRALSDGWRKPGRSSSRARQPGLPGRLIASVPQPTARRRPDVAQLNGAATAALRGAGVSQAVWIRASFTIGRWGGDARGCPDDRCIGCHHGGPDDCGCLAGLLATPSSWLNLEAGW
jgi:hypothetical protein